MNLMNYGYKEEKIKVRKMSIAELRLGIVQELLKKNYRYVNIRLVRLDVNITQPVVITGANDLED